MTTKKIKLKEGFVRMQLKTMVKNKIIIDEYKPKAGTEAEIVVVTFIVYDEAAGRDLSRFIELGPDDIVDIDFSEFPTSDYEWYVHMELQRNDQFWSTLDSILADIANLTGDLDWNMEMYISGETLNYAKQKDRIVKQLVLDPDKYMSKREYNASIARKKIKDFLNKSFVQGEIMEDGFRAGSNTYAVSSYGRFEEFAESIIPFKENTDTKALRASLGEEYQVYMTEGSGILLINNETDLCMNVQRAS